MSEQKFSKRREVSAVILLACAILLGITYYVPSASTGVIGDIFLGFGRGMFGVSAFALPVMLLYAAFEFIFSQSKQIRRNRISHVFILLIIVACLMHAFSLDLGDFRSALGGGSEQTATSAIALLWQAGRDDLVNTLPNRALPGGLFPGLLVVSLQSLAGDTGAIIILLMALVVELVLLFNFSVSRIIGKTGSAVKHAGQKVGSAISQTVQTASERRQTDKTFDIPLDDQSWNEDPSYNATPLEAFDDSGKKAQTKPGAKYKKKEDNGGSPAADSGAPEAKDEPFKIDVSTYKPKQQNTSVPKLNDAAGRDTGFYQVGGSDPSGKTLPSREDQAVLASYPQEPAEPDHQSNDMTGAANTYFDGIPILSYDPEPEEDRRIIVGPDQGAESEGDPFSVPEFLQQSKSGRKPDPSQQRDSGQADAGELAENDQLPANSTGIRPSRVNEVKGTDAAPPVENRYGKKIGSDRVRAVAAEDIESFAEDIEEPPYLLPSTALLNQEDRSNFRQNQEQIAGLGRKLEETLKSFGVEAKVVNITTGPSITRFELTPGIGVKVSKITNLADDIALNLAAVGVRIEAPIPGKSAIGIEIPNKSTSIVGLRALIESREFRESKSKLTVALGRDIPGAPVFCDLARMPHLLIAGATGAGKSVCINSILVSLLYRTNPNEVKLLMIDPKVVELSIYNGIPHLLAPVVTDPKKASNTLNWAVVEMNRRYDLFAKKNVRDLLSYNSLAERDEFEKVPQMVIVIDELADLMLAAPHEVEDSIARLTAMARAAGMHLIIATQRPSVDVITGVIKANIPSRVAFMVSSQVDSRTILDTGGAEKLLGKGDMLYAPQSLPKPVRGQGAFITEEEVERVVKFCKNQNSREYDKELQEEIVSTKPLGQSQDSADGADQDDLFVDAVDIIVDAGYASVSILQRRLNVGYPRAGKLIDAMEQAGYIGPFEGSKPRKLLLTRPQWEQIKMGTSEENNEEREDN